VHPPEEVHGILEDFEVHGEHSEFCGASSLGAVVEARASRLDDWRYYEEIQRDGREREVSLSQREVTPRYSKREDTTRRLATYGCGVDGACCSALCACREYAGWGIIPYLGALAMGGSVGTEVLIILFEMIRA